MHGFVSLFVCLSIYYQVVLLTDVYSRRHYRTWHETETNGASLNSEGLPNSGIDYYLDSQTITDSMAADPSKPYMVSISGKTLEDNIAMLKKIVKHPNRVAAIELNLACPNIIGKPIIACTSPFPMVYLLLLTGDLLTLSLYRSNYRRL